MYSDSIGSDGDDRDGDSSRDHRLAEKELFLLLLVGIAILMGATGYVLIVT